MALAIASFINLPGIPKIDLSNTDKIFHFLAYSLLSWLWFYVFYFKFKWTKNKSLITTTIISVLFGIIIEVLQSIITNTRVADNNDILANTLGVLLTIIIIILLKKQKLNNINRLLF